MPQFQTKRSVRHSASRMFNLVADIERYPEFVPMCERLAIRRRTEGEGGVVMLLADMSIGYKMIRETFTTKVRLDHADSGILVEYVDGPFSHLENRWSFKDVPSGCEINFFIDYAFKSRTFGMLAGAVFDTVFRKMAQSFETRADKIYGSKSS